MEAEWRTDPAPIGTVAEILIHELPNSVVKDRLEELYGETAIGIAVEVEPAPGFEVIPRFGQWWKVGDMPLVRVRKWRPIDTSEQLELGF